MTSVEELLKDVDKLLAKKPFFRGCPTFDTEDPNDELDVTSDHKIRSKIPARRQSIVAQNRFLKELDPACHDVMFDQNIPDICVKLADGTMQRVTSTRIGLPIQNMIRNSHTLHACGNPTYFSLRGATPTDTDKRNYELIKEYWTDRNIDGVRTKAVHTQNGVGDAGVLFYINRKQEIKCRLISYEDGYDIITHKDDNGEHILECVHYYGDDGLETVDCYDDTYLHRLVKAADGWERTDIEHGFDEIPLVTKRGDVAWNGVQSLIDVYEIMYNIYTVIEKRHGWGILYVRGKFKDEAREIAGNVILNDTSVDGNGKVEAISAPSSQGITDYLDGLWKNIMRCSNTTFILPEDIRSSGDISGLAVMLTQMLDLEEANRVVAEWQNFMDKMLRLFMQGLAKELVKKGINEYAVTEFARLRMSAKLKVWRPFNETEYNQMLVTLKGAGIISAKTAIEKNTISAPDEQARIAVETEESNAMQRATSGTALQTQSE